MNSYIKSLPFDWHDYEEYSKLHPCNFKSHKIGRNTLIMRMLETDVSNAINETITNELVYKWILMNANKIFQYCSIQEFLYKSMFNIASDAILYSIMNTYHKKLKYM